MNRRLKQTAIGLVGLFAAAQLVRPARANPPTDASRAIAAQPRTSSDLVIVLGRACGEMAPDRSNGNSPVIIS